MSELIRRLGKISSASLTYEDHGILTCFVSFDFGDSCQGFGGYALDSYNKTTKNREGTAPGLDWIIWVLRALDAPSLEKLSGRVCYALKASDSFMGPIIGLQAIEPEGGKSFLISDWKKRWEINE